MPRRGRMNEAVSTEQPGLSAGRCLCFTGNMFTSRDRRPRAAPERTGGWRLATVARADTIERSRGGRRSHPPLPPHRPSRGTPARPSRPRHPPHDRRRLRLRVAGGWSASVLVAARAFDARSAGRGRSARPGRPRRSGRGPRAGLPGNPSREHHVAGGARRCAASDRPLSSLKPAAACCRSLRRPQPGAGARSAEGVAGDGATRVRAGTGLRRIRVQR